MAASYPSSAKSFTTKTNNSNTDASQINDVQDEITAIEQDLIAGLPVSRGGTGLTAAFVANRIPYSNGSALTSAATFTFDGTTFTVPATTMTGLLDVSGAAAGQVKFPATQVPSTNVNTFDDYEEGTWTPTITGSGGSSGQVYTTQVGKYTKKGKEVTAYFHVRLSTLGTVTTSAQVGGLPFAIENTASCEPSLAVGFYTGLSTAMVQLSGIGTLGGTVITLYGSTAAAGGLTALVQTDLGNTTAIYGSITYMASA